MSGGRGLDVVFFTSNLMGIEVAAPVCWAPPTP